MGINKKDYTELRDIILEVIPVLSNTNSTVTVGNNQLSCRNGLVRFGDVLGVNRKNFPHHYCQVGEEGYLSADDIVDIGKAIKIQKKYMK